MTTRVSAPKCLGPRLRRWASAAGNETPFLRLDARTLSHKVGARNSVVGASP